MLKPWRGIADFLSAFTGTIDPGVKLTVREDETLGYAVYAGYEKIAVVALAVGDTKEQLLEELHKLYRAKLGGGIEVTDSEEAKKQQVTPMNYHWERLKNNALALFEEGAGETPEMYLPGSVCVIVRVPPSVGENRFTYRTQGEFGDSTQVFSSEQAAVAAVEAAVRAAGHTIVGL